MTPEQLFNILENTGNHYSYFKKGTKYVHFSTGGWSDNEDLIFSLKQERVYNFLICEWKSGGHYKFTIPTKELMHYDFQNSNSEKK